MTGTSEREIDGRRDLTTIQWYAIPLLAIVLYIYAGKHTRPLVWA